MAAPARLPRDGAPLRKKALAKLPSSADVAVTLPFASRTEYGLGRSGILELWIDESYRAIAPKRLVSMLELDPPPEPRKPHPRTPAKRPPRRSRARS
jgi:hypothetical protein